MGNQLVECQECHNLYHQDCHKPQVTDKDVNDPRLVWYCARCTRQMKRMVRTVHFVTTLTHPSLGDLPIVSVLFFFPPGTEATTEAVSRICVISASRKRHSSEEG